MRLAFFLAVALLSGAPGRCGTDEDAAAEQSARFDQPGRLSLPFMVLPHRLGRPVDLPSLFESRGRRVFRMPQARDEDFNDLYLIAAPLSSEELSAYGQVLRHEPGNFLIMKVAPGSTAALSRKLHESGCACGALIRLYGDPMELRAAVPEPAPLVPVAQELPEITAAAAKIDAAKIQDYVDQISAIHTRYHESRTGREAAAVLARIYESLKGQRQDVEIELYAHEGRTPQPSLIVRIIGRKHPNEIVVLGSHIDSINWRDGEEARAPGADDDASGTAVNLEIFRVLMQEGLALDRTLEIHGYAAEEIGLVGSQHMASNYRSQGKAVVAQLQHDMTLYRSGEKDMIWLVTNNTNPSLTRDLGVLIERYAGVGSGRAPLYAGSSDHVSWHRKGYPVAFPSENPKDFNPRIHTANDTTRGASFTQAAAFARLGLAYAGHYAGASRASRVIGRR